jgi:sporulation protein YlmC with PRC-barrel domain
MIRKLMASTAVLALMSTGAFTIAQAQDSQTNPPVVEEQAQTTAPATEAEPTTELAASEQALMPEQPTFATAFIGKSVFSSEDPESDNIGDINDLILNEDGSITHAVVGVGGFLGIGEKDVAVPFDELEIVEKDGDIRFIYAASREQLEAAPALDRTAFDPAARATAEQTASTDAAAPVEPVPAEPSQDMAAAPAAEEPAAPTEEQTTAAAPAAEEPAAPAEQETAAAPAAEEPAAPAEEQTTATAPATEEPAATAEQETAAAPAAEEPAAPAEEQTAAAPATEEEPAAPAEEMTTATTEEAVPAEPSQDMAATAPADATKAPAEDLTAAPAEEEVAAAPEAETTTAPATSGELNFVSFSADQFRASKLIGQSVYSGEESIGEISDLILQDEGETRAALIDVGGFLGVGEKTVGIPFDQLQVSKAEDGSEQVTVAMSKADLEKLPAIEKPAETATTEQPVAPTAPATGEEPATTGSVATEAPLPPYEAATQEVAASQLIGASVYGSDDASIGEISDVLFDKTGNIEAAVVDVGGFLGIGEKPVGVAFDTLKVREDQNGKLSVMVAATQEQLESAPTFEEPAPAAATVQ